MPRVLDTSALLSGRQFPGELLSVPEVLRELDRRRSPQLDAILETHVKLVSPGPVATGRVLSTSEVTGDAPRLSPTDVALVALALETGSTLVTDDYSMQNVCQVLAIPYETVMEPGIAETWTWAYRCTGCGKTWPTWHDHCPTCGARVRTARRPTP